MLGEDRKKIPFIITLFILASFLDILGIGLIGPYVALVVEGENSNLSVELFSLFNRLGFTINFNQLVLYFGFVLLLCFVLKGISSIIINYLIIKFSLSRTAKLRGWLMDKYQNMSYLEYVNRNSSEYITAVNNFAGSYSQSLKNILKMTSEGIVFIFILSLLFYTSPFALIILVAVLSSSVFLFEATSRNKIREAGEIQNRYNVNLIKSVNESVNGIKEIRVFGKENFFKKRIEHITEKMMIYSVRSGILTMVPRHLLETVLVFFLVSLVMVSMLLYKNLSDILPILGVFSAAALRILPTVTSLTAGIAQLRVNRYGIGFIYKDLKNYPQKSYSNSDFSKELNSKEFLDLEFLNVSFKYPKSSKNALTSVNFKYSSGESIGLIGSSGSGKTTLVNIMLGLLKPNEGEILFNGNSISKNTKNWLDKVAYLPQDIFLIDDKLINNIAIGEKSEKIDKLKITMAIKMAKVDKFVNDLPNGLETIIGQNGLKLSGGQKQRIALARAFYNAKDVIIMDEATSALDSQVEKEIINEIKQLKGKITTFIIAHRLSTLEHCDRIYEIKNGSIVNHGDFASINK